MAFLEIVIFVSASSLAIASLLYTLLYANDKSN